MRIFVIIVILCVTYEISLSLDRMEYGADNDVKGDTASDSSRTHLRRVRRTHLPKHGKRMQSKAKLRRFGYCYRPYWNFLHYRPNVTKHKKVTRSGQQLKRARSTQVNTSKKARQYPTSKVPLPVSSGDSDVSTSAAEDTPLGKRSASDCASSDPDMSPASPNKRSRKGNDYGSIE